jgi:ribose 1,5-bisphosphokinase PhnN
MKWVLNILGVPLFLMGIVWILQGTGLYPVGFMAHQIKYTYAGIVVDLIAIGLIVIANRRRKNLPPSTNA